MKNPFDTLYLQKFSGIQYSWASQPTEVLMHLTIRQRTIFFSTKGFYQRHWIDHTEDDLPESGPNSDFLKILTHNAVQQLESGFSWWCSDVVVSCPAVWQLIRYGKLLGFSCLPGKWNIGPWIIALNIGRFNSQSNLCWIWKALKSTLHFYCLKCQGNGKVYFMLK